ncbi:peptidyl-prolyl cis-trans isomerase, partial [Clavulina sp. PMI_390]
AKKGKTLSMRYILKLGNGKIVDKNTSGKPFKFTLGAGEVIKGWDEGLVGMKVGAERMLEIPPQMGYGKRKMSDIPANSTLYFGTCFLCLVVGS